MSDEKAVGQVDDAQRLRNMLFETMKRLQNKQISAEDAKAMAEVGQTIVNSAKAELEFAKLAGKGLPTNYLPRAAQSMLTQKKEEGED